MPFWNRKKLIDYDLKTLDLGKIWTLQASLMAKLLLVNKELVRRYIGLLEATHELDNMEDSHKVFADSAARLNKLNIVLEDELASVIKPPK